MFHTIRWFISTLPTNALRIFFFRLLGCKMGKKVSVGKYTSVGPDVMISNNVKIGSNVKIINS